MGLYVVTGAAGFIGSKLLMPFFNKGIRFMAWIIFRPLTMSV